MGWDESLESEELLRFTAWYFADLSEGRQRTVEEYIALFPAFPDRIRRAFAELQEAGEEANAAAADVETPGGAADLGSYRILSELGRGGQGIVYLAEDRRLHRKVALKVLRGFASQSTAMRRRLAREAEAVSRLDHPGLCTVYEVGESQGAPFIAMRFVEGRTLARSLADARAGEQRLDALAGTAPPGSGSTSTGGSTSRAGVMRAVRLIEAVARALHVAHEAGLVHRDVKPGNIMVTGDGEPVLLDFGLARDEVSTDHSLTRTGEILGTPAYMSPEQVRGERSIDRRTDVYSLGVTLYELLSLRRPFDAPTREPLYQAILAGEAPDPRRVNPAIPKELRTVLRVAMAVDLDRRYQTALDLADDLERVRTLQPIRARPTPLPQRLQRWVQRNPAATWILVLTTAALVVTFALLGEVSREKTATEQALAESRLLGLVAASEKAMATDPMLALLLAREAFAIDPRWETLSQLHRVLAEPLPAAILESEPERPWTTGAFAEEGGLIAAVGQRDATGTARHLALWEESSGRLVSTFEAVDQILYFEISPAGDRAALGFADGRLQFADLTDRSGDGTWVRDARGITRLPADPTLGVLVFFGDTRVVLYDWEGRAVEELAATPAPVIDLVSAGDGLLLACGNGGLERRDGLGRPIPHQASRLPDAARSRSFVLSPRGSLVLTALPRQVWLHDLATGREWEIARPRGESALWGHLWGGFAPDGQHFFTSYQDGVVCLWDHQGRHIRTIGDAGFEVVRACRFTPDSQRLVVGGWHAAARTFDLQGNELGAYRTPGATLGSALSADGARLLTVTHSPHVWHLEDAELRRYTGHGAAPVHVAVAPDGRVATGTEFEARCRVWEPGAPGFRVLVPADLEPASAPDGIFTMARTAVAWSPDGALLLTGPMHAADRVSRLWDTETWTVKATLSGHTEALWDAAFTAEGGEVFTASGDGTARRWSPTGELLTVYGVDEPAPPDALPNWRYVFSVHSAGNHVVTVHADGSVRLWSLDGGAPVRTIRYEGADPPNCARFLPGGKRFVVSYNDGALRFWSLDETSSSTVLGAHAFRVKVSPRGDRLAAGGLDGVARLFDLDGGLLAELRGHTGRVLDVAFSPDGRKLLTASVDRTVRTWLVYAEDLRSLADRRAVRELTTAERSRYGLGERGR